MAKNSKIEWTDHTINLWWGCSKVHTGCKNCYAETLSKRWGNKIWGENSSRKLIKSAFSDLEKYQREAEKQNKKVRVFCGSMMDIFEDSKPMHDSNRVKLDITTGDQRNILFEGIENGMYDNLIFLFLTKRPENLERVFMPKFESWLYGMPKNVWIGTSISNEETAGELIPKLMRVRGNIFLSVEPQIDYIDIRKFVRLSNGALPAHPLIDWVIQGGESGTKKRPFDNYWALSMQKHCKEAGMPYFFKQIDKVQEIPENLLVREFPKF